MKKIYVLLLVISFLGYSCNDKSDGYDPGNSTDKEVELRIVQSASGTRATVPYPSAIGTEQERRILSLDILAFDPTTKEFLYTRPAYPSSGNIYRATVPSQYPVVDVVLLANCPGAYIQSSAWTAKKWEDIQDLIIDNDPGRLVNSSVFKELPMSSEVLEKRKLSDTGIGDWETATLMRSVASIDVLMEKTSKTNKLEIVRVYTYFTPDQGYISAKNMTQPGKENQYVTPAGMHTTLIKSVSGIGETQTEVPAMSYDAITSQIYLYDNNLTNPYSENSDRGTRIIVEGYYDQANVVGTKTPTFYPIFLHDGGEFRPIIRNYKYVINIDEVYGEGYKDIIEASKSSPINLNVNVAPWNLNELEAGASDPYYVSLTRKKAYLARYADSEDEILITYKGERDDKFRLDFKDIHNGAQTDITNGIKNDRFEVTITSENGKATLTVKALGAYSTTDDTENRDIVILKYRNLHFEVEIEQLDAHDYDWSDGGDITIDF